jgi:NAD(P)-dependent dehydrogenase (short-subunit alcohol dehydrogenase family)
MKSVQFAPPTTNPNKTQVILVVGGTSGIGYAITQSILSSPYLHLNAKVIAFGLLESTKLDFTKQQRERLRIVEGDVTEEEDRELAIKTCFDVFGGLDTLIYSAGVITPIERIEKVDVEKIKRSFDINVFGAMSMVSNRSINPPTYSSFDWSYATMKEPDRYGTHNNQVQQTLPHLRTSRIQQPLNAGHGKILILSSACDSSVTYHGWTPYCTTKAALTRFISCLAHEEPILSVQGVYPRLTRTKMIDSLIGGRGRYDGVMADHELERFRVWEGMGDEMVEPPQWCGEAVAKLALGLFEGGKSGETLYYDEHVPRKIAGT